MATTTRKIVYVRRLLVDFGVFLTTPTPLTCDNHSAVKIGTSPFFYVRMKHNRSIATSLVSISLQALYHFYVFVQKSRL